MPRKYLFLDAGAVAANYRELASDLSEASISLDIMSLAAYGGDRFDRIFYYDAIPNKRPDESEYAYADKLAEKERELSALSQISNVHVRTGTAKFRKKKGLEQKGVDVLIAIDMLRFAFQGHMDEAWLWSSDLDMYPALDALTETRVQTTLLYAPRTTSRELVACADRSVALTVKNLLRWAKEPELVKKHSIDCYGDLRTNEKDCLRQIRSGKVDSKELLLYESTKRARYMCYWNGRCCFGKTERAIFDEMFEGKKIDWDID